MSEIKKATFRLRKSNFPIFPAQMGKLPLFQHETFRHTRESYYKQLQTITFHLIVGILIVDCRLGRSYAPP